MEGDSLGHELITTGGPKRNLAMTIDEKDQSPPFKTESDKNESKREGGAPTTHTKNPPPPTREHVIGDRKG